MSQLFDILSILFPPSATVTAMRTDVAPSDMKNAELIINSTLSKFSAVELFRLEFEIVNGHFHDFRLAAGLKRARLTENVESWRILIQSADEQISANGLGPLKSVLLAFSGYVATLPLTRHDRAILTACAVKEWAPNAHRGIQAGEETIQFSASDYSKLPTGQWRVIRDSDCYPQRDINCETDECRSMADFLNKSARKNARNAAAELYIDESLTLVINNSVTELSTSDYVENVLILHPAIFEKKQVIENQWSFVFKPSTLPLIYKGTNYRSYQIKINIVADLSDNGSRRFFVTSIEASNES